MKKLRKVILTLLALLLLIMGLLHLFQEKVIFLQEPIDVKYVYQFPFDFEEVNLKTEDNKTINALHIKAKKPKGIILYFHGNQGNLIRWGEITSYFTQFNYDVFVIDYRGYGKSTGDFNETKMYNDALLSYEYVKQQFDEQNIVVYGRSLGTTFATKVGSENNPKHVVLEAPFYNLHHAANYKYKVIPKFILNFKFKSNKYITKIKSPITIFHGTEDTTTPIEGSKQLFELITTTKKEFISLKKGTHHNVRDFEEYTNALKSILAN
jgi:alpha-beta hydrolase superfamily lysophospholipase